MCELFWEAYAKVSDFNLEEILERHEIDRHYSVEEIIQQEINKRKDD